MKGALSWRPIAWLLIVAATILSASQWPAFPYFLDSYYHLSVIQGFREAAGVVLHSFWEAAPEGQPHLYPPLFHLLFLPASLAHLPPLVIARFWSWAAFPGLLLVAWTVLKSIFTERIACLSLILLATPFSFFLAAVNYLPATLSLMAILGLMLAVQKGKSLAGGLLLSLIFWLHAGLPWLVVLSLTLFGLLEPERRKTTGIILAIGIVGALPWLIHLSRHVALLKFHARGEDLLLESPILLVALGLLGLRTAWRENRFLFSLAVGFLPMGLLYPFRFFSAQGLFPWLLLAGLTLENGMKRSSKKGWVAAGLFLFSALSPTLRATPEGIRWVWADTTFLQLSGLSTGVPRVTQQPLFHESLMRDLVKTIVAHSEPDDLIGCNLPYIGGMLSVLTGRATTTEMLGEMNNHPRDGPIEPAKVIVWLKNPSERSNLPEGLKHYGLEPIAETELAWILKNPQAMGRRRVTKAVVPWGLAWGGLTLVLALIVWDLKR